MEEHYLQHRLGETHFLTWGDRQAPPLLLVHGLGGQAANYLELAEYLATTYRVIAPDLPGRGLSTWLTEQDYCFAYYQDVILALLTALKVDQLRWVGTSMGGALGFYMAADGLAGRVTHLVANDIGPTLPETVAQAIAQGTSQLPVADTLQALAQRLAESFAAMSGLQRPLDYWIKRARYFSRRCEDGRYTLHYDPQVASQLIHHPSDFEQWDNFAAIDIPLMVIWGQRSEVLNREIFARMQAEKPAMSSLVIPDCGHAPLLDEENVLASIGEFLAVKTSGNNHDH